MNPLATSTATSPLEWTSQGAFASLGPTFFTALEPTPLPQPHWIGTSTDVAQLLALDADWMASDEALHAFTGNARLPGSSPLASVYSGHQFGVWAGQLGDGRAILLGETMGGLEVQLKGSGRTPYSRMGDGRAVLRSSIREFLCSEAMHALGIPTSRALCLTGSPAPVRREEIETAAVVTRVAQSFIRFGHFEHFAARGKVFYRSLVLSMAAVSGLCWPDRRRRFLFCCCWLRLSLWHGAFMSMISPYSMSQRTRTPNFRRFSGLAQCGVGMRAPCCCGFLCSRGGQ